MNSLFTDACNRNDLGVSISTFLTNLITNTQISPSILITALILINRLKSLHPNCKCSSSSRHRLLMAAILLAAKTTNDDTYNNKSWASASNGLFDLEQINQMEKEFLWFIDYRIFVSDIEWTIYSEVIERSAQNFNKLS